MGANGGMNLQSLMSGQLNPYNYNPYQQNAMGGASYGMMNAILQKLQNPASIGYGQPSLFTSGPSLQGIQFPSSFQFGQNMNPIQGMPSINQFTPYMAPQVAPQKGSSGSGGMSGGEYKKGGKN